ncbi:chromosome-associated kinesin KIF4A-like [Tripterygium wilfordii]|uniref:Chromosome-associated kinesin KIF4A-like n=1 Tax=Tripterygium wilfordii TaxID=458696 RepID=A0A7J7D3H0_TRIWF|nr:chromosome-associated kinesin KIF4A-like [Tripterygium wilfordii]
METLSSPPCPNTVTVRRNPHRKARPTTTTKPLVPPSSSSDRPEIAPFPIDDILSIQINQNPQIEPSSSSIQSPVSENLKVYLRIRPIVPLKGSSRSNVGNHNEISRNKNVWPQNPASKKKNSARETCTKNKSGEGCITVNDSQSVTLSPPPALQDSKRIKSEVYQGFSHVFSADSSQNEVYEKMVSPLVKDFLEGKSGMLTALGPSGSGKTHTVFGSPREPGMIPLVLQQIFKQTYGSNPNSRLFYISMFEICSERGKGERIFDLSPDGADLSMQRSTIKGLQEAIISDTSHAESLIASAILKRATAMTNTNRQSSRSQCIINIRSVVNKLDGEVDLQSNDAILTIVDLAGAEREKRTGNQGTRLLESNFINNTSMVFGLCLRSLLEHQKNPRKPLQKHFQNSLLTRYLRDYLEGKKRMALILTVRSGQEDYLDTSHVLRQASPYMKIKLDSLPDSPFLFKGVATINKLGATDSDPLESDSLEKSGRTHRIMQSFAKATWNVLKEYRDKLRLAESEIQNLSENLRNEKTKYFELEKELKDLKCCCACTKENVADDNIVEVDALYVEECPNLKRSECDNTPEKDDFISRQVEDVISQVNARASPSSSKEIEHDKDEQEIHTTFFSIVAEECANKMSSGNKINADKLDESKISAVVHIFSTEDVTGVCSQLHRNTHPARESGYPGMSLKGMCVVLNFGSVASSSSLVEMVNDNTISTSNLPEMLHKEDEVAESEIQNLIENLRNENVADDNIVGVDALYVDEVNARASPSSSKKIELDKDEQEIHTTEPLELSVAPEKDVALTQDSTVFHAPTSQPTPNASCKSLKLEKPKRRLLPASSILLRDIGALDVEDETEKSRVS